MNNSTNIFNSINDNFNQKSSDDCGCNQQQTDFSSLQLAGPSTYSPNSNKPLDLRGLTLASNQKPKSSCSINNLKKSTPIVQTYNGHNTQNIGLNSIADITSIDPTQNNSNNNTHNTHDIYDNNINDNIKDTLKDSYSFAVKNINLAFVLIAAFAWNDAIKYFIARLIKLDRGTPYYYLYYALIITLMAVIVFRISSRFTNN